MLELHSHKATRKEVAAALGDALHQQPKPPHGLGEAERQRAVLRREQLNGHAQAVSEVRWPLGRSLHEAIGRVAQLSGLDIALGPRVAAVDQSLSEHQLASWLDVAGRLSRAWGPVERGEDFLWGGVVTQRDAATPLRSALADLDTLQRVAAAATVELRLPTPTSRAAAPYLAAVLDHRQGTGPHLLADRRPRRGTRRRRRRR